MKNYYLLFISFLLTQQLSAQGDFYFNITSPFSVQQSLGPGEYGITAGDWGWDGTLPNDFFAEMVYATEDDNGGHFFCDEDATDYTGKVVLVERGGCFFAEKALNAQNQGAVAVVMYNFDEEIIDMGSSASSLDVTIPFILISKSVGDGLIFELLNGSTVIVGFSHTASPFNLINGSIILDENIDCQNTIGEPTLQNWKIHTQGTNGYSKINYSDANGHFQLFADSGDYELNLIAPNPMWQTCPPVTISAGIDDTITVDLQGQVLAFCPVMTVDIETPLLRRCFDNNVYKVNYCNQGTLTGEAAYVTVQFDDLISVESSSLAYTELDFNTYSFMLGDVEMNECGSFTITTLVSCDAEFDQTLCAFANIYPQENCDTGGESYSGPSVKIKGDCTGDEVFFEVKNIGAGDMDTPSEYTVIKNDEIIETGNFQLVAGTTQTYSFPANGATYRLEAVQAIGYPEESSPSFTIEACADGTDEFDTGYFNMYPPSDYGFAYDEECNPVIGSFDPNDKTPTPFGHGDEHFIEKNTDIHYLIRFQNTGTDTAFNIVVRDTLSNYFDIPTLDLGVSSHDFTFRILEDNILEFKFNNIMLPDSNVNEVASHGYFSYQLKQKNDLELGTVIRNSAAIYFDFNEPIITNETFHTIGENFVGTNSIVTLDKNLSIQVYPNPMNEYVIFDLQNIAFLEGQLELINSIGQSVRVVRFQESNFEVKRKGLNAGTYFFKLSLDNQLSATGMIQILGD